MAVSLKRPAIIYEKDEHMEAELSTISEFLAKGCGCNLGSASTNCIRLFTTEEVEFSRNSVAELSGEEN